jgi:F-type H+-transporting ATPase subunit alpha
LGILPAIDIGRSVSRVGGKAQRAAFRAVAGNLKLAYAQFEELETFVRFGARLDEGSRFIIQHGKRIRACLKQAESSPIPVPEQITLLLALSSGLFDEVPLMQMIAAQNVLKKAVHQLPSDLCERFETAAELSKEDRKIVVELATKVLLAFQPKPNLKQNKDE